MTDPGVIDAVAAYRFAERMLADRDQAGALRALEPVLRAEPDSRSVLELAGRAWFSSAQLAKAESAFRRLVEVDPADPYARFVLGRCVERQGRATEAVGHYRVAVALDPREDYCAALARCAERRGGPSAG
jgi:Flp pilus assembly protein TadD